MYSITKTALLAMVKVLALELSNKCIRVNAVNPGLFNTDMATRVCIDNVSTVSYLFINIFICLLSIYRRIKLSRNG